MKWRLFCLGFALSSAIYFPERGCPQESTDSKARSIAELCESLASSNPVPMPTHDPFSKFTLPDGYDTHKRDAIVQSIKMLLDAGVVAFPELVGHCRDKRYSLTQYTLAGGVGNQTVGQVCWRILESQVRAGIPGDTKYRHSFSVPGDATAWWEERKHFSLWELQADAMEAKLHSLRRIAEQEKPPRTKWEKADRAQLSSVIHKLETNLSEIKATRKPFPARLRLKGIQ